MKTEKTHFFLGEEQPDGSMRLLDVTDALTDRMWSDLSECEPAMRQRAALAAKWPQSKAAKAGQ